MSGVEGGTNDKGLCQSATMDDVESGRDDREQGSAGVPRGTFRIIVDRGNQNHARMLMATISLNVRMREMMMAMRSNMDREDNASDDDCD